MTWTFVRCFAVLLALTAPGFPGTPLTPAQKAFLAKGNRHDKAGWIYLHKDLMPSRPSQPWTDFTAGEVP